MVILVDFVMAGLPLPSGVVRWVLVVPVLPQCGTLAGWAHAGTVVISPTAVTIALTPPSSITRADRMTLLLLSSGSFLDPVNVVGYQSVRLTVHLGGRLCRWSF